MAQPDVSPEFGGDQFFGKCSVSACDHRLGHVPTGAQYRYCITINNSFIILTIRRIRDVDVAKDDENQLDGKEIEGECVVNMVQKPRQIIKMI